MKYAAVGFLAIVLLTLGASAQIAETDKGPRPSYR